MFVYAWSVVGAAAGAERQLPAFEMPKEFVPFFVGRSAVFLAGPLGAAPGDERSVAVDDFLGVDGLVSHRGVDISMADHQLSDVGWHPVHDRVGDEQPSEVVWDVSEWSAAGVVAAETG